MSSKPVYSKAKPLPASTTKALSRVHRLRGLSERRLADAIGTTHPHVGRIMAGKSRPSVILAHRLGIALDLPLGFTILMASQSSTAGRKMRHPDGFDATALVGNTPCPVSLAAAYQLMREAMDIAGEFKEAELFDSRYGLLSVRLLATMGDEPEYVVTRELDPWDWPVGDPLIVWRDKTSTLSEVTVGKPFEFIATIDPESVIRCNHHGR